MARLIFEIKARGVRLGLRLAVEERRGEFGVGNTVSVAIVLFIRGTKENRHISDVVSRY